MKEGFEEKHFFVIILRILLVETRRPLQEGKTPYGKLVIVGCWSAAPLGQSTSAIRCRAIGRTAEWLVSRVSPALRGTDYPP